MGGFLRVAILCFEGVYLLYPEFFRFFLAGSLFYFFILRVTIRFLLYFRGKSDKTPVALLFNSISGTLFFENEF
ncbi:MAG: hypothetical protein R2757_09740 [Draconibacterium sp.]